jgi:hypothetical protein
LLPLAVFGFVIFLWIRFNAFIETNPKTREPLNERYVELVLLDNHVGGSGVCTPPHIQALKEQLTAVGPNALPKSTGGDGRLNKEEAALGQAKCHLYLVRCPISPSFVVVGAQLLFLFRRG